MELTLRQSKQAQGVAIIMMVTLHLFNTLDYEGIFKPLIFIGDRPLIYYISLFCDACVPIYLFISGYGLYFQYANNKAQFISKNIKRIKKLYLLYWVILVIFVLLLGPILGKSDKYPGSFTNFLFNVTAIHTGYSSVWWYITIYILLVLFSPLLFKIMNRYSNYILLILIFVLHFIAYIQRIKNPFEIEGFFYRHILANNISLFFHSLFSFYIGAFFYKEKIISKIKMWFIQFNSQFANIIIFIGVISLIIIHGLIPTLFIAPFTGITFLVLFSLKHFNGLVGSILDFLGKHSLNIWLVHMFFYMQYFPKFIFRPNYVPLIFILLLTVCLITSIILMPIQNYLIKKLV